LYEKYGLTGKDPPTPPGPIFPAISDLPAPPPPSGGVMMGKTRATFTSYSRGYKNRAIVKKFFETLPNFYSCLECQHFVLIMFFDTRKGLNCLQWTFFLLISLGGPP
jgi:hypothetical protein